MRSVTGGYWAWNNLGGGEGIWRNVLRNMVVVALIFPGFGALGRLLSRDGSLESDTQKDKGDAGSLDESDDDA